MARKTKNIITSEKKFTTVPPKAKPATEAVAAKPAVVAEVAAPVVAPVATATKAEVVEVKASIAPLLIALHDIDADIASDAAAALGKTADAAAVEPLIEIVQNAKGYFHSVVRSAAAVSLGQLKDRRAIEALLHAVDDSIADPSTEAIRALVTLADPRAIAKLVEVVRNENNFFAGSVRRAAVLGLITLGGDTAVSTLRQVAANEHEDTVIRHEAAEAIKGK